MHVILFTLTFVFVQLVFYFHVCQVSTNFYMFELWILEYDFVYGKGC